jgi:hypothetical protein
MKAIRILIPLGLAILAGLLNLMAFRGGAAPIEVVTASQDLPADTVLHGDQLQSTPLRADPDVIGRSVVRYADRGAALLGRKIKRSVKAGELIFFEDVRQEGGEGLRQNLRPGEVALLVSLERIPYSPNLLNIGTEVGFVLGDPSQVGSAPAGQGKDPTPVDPKAQRILGPFRIVSVGDSTEPREAQPSGQVEERKVISVAIQPNKDGLLGERDTSLVNALKVTEGKQSVVAVVVYAPGTRPSP